MSRPAAQAAKARHADGDAAGGKAFGEDIALDGDTLLTVQARGRGVEHQIDSEKCAALLVLAEEHAAIPQHRRTPDACAVQPPRADKDVLRLLVNEHTVADLLGQARERALVQFALARVGGAVALCLLGGLLEKTLRVGTHGLIRRALAAREPQMTAAMAASQTSLP